MGNSKALSILKKNEDEIIAFPHHLAHFRIVFILCGSTHATPEAISGHCKIIMGCSILLLAYDYDCY
jgi:hypothetical protein